MYTILLYSTAIELIKVLTWCTNINIKYSNVDIRMMILYKHCMLCCVHTADL